MGYRGNPASRVLCLVPRPTMGRRSPLLSLLWLLVVVTQVASSGFRICAYNLQEFDKVKASNPRVIHTLTRVIGPTCQDLQRCWLLGCDSECVRLCRCCPGVTSLSCRKSWIRMVAPWLLCWPLSTGTGRVHLLADLSWLQLEKLCLRSLRMLRLPVANRVAHVFALPPALSLKSFKVLLSLWQMAPGQEWACHPRKMQLS